MQFPNKKYNIIYADPPWSYRDSMSGALTNSVSACDHYAVMVLDEIKELPVREICEKDCALFMWCVSPQIPAALEVMESWGFKYVTVVFCWSKLTSTGKMAHNLGRWTLGNVELCLLGRKGKIGRISRNIRQLVQAKRTRHSEKPAEVRDRIVALMGDVPRIELFARHAVSGRDRWGLEAPDEV
jgi:site-specific DNA-methyltransferase (adenine-specific)